MNFIVRLTIIFNKMDDLEETSCYEFRVKVVKVQLTVKFPCRMYLRYDHQKVTQDVKITNPYQFVFGQELTLQDAAMKGACEIQAYLTTEKGNQILAGVIKIQNNELLQSQGHEISLGLSNCLDALAKCEIKVLKIRNIRNPKVKESFRYRAPSGTSSLRPFSTKDIEYYGHRSNITLKDKQMYSQHFIDDSHREGQAYRQSRFNPLSREPSQRKKSDYSRQKYKIQFQTLETNLRVDIAKYRKRLEELETLNQDKLKMIKNLNQELNNIKISKYHQLYYNEELQCKNQMLLTYESYLQELKKQNEQLRKQKLQLAKAIAKIEENQRFEKERFEATFESEKANLQKEKELAQEDAQLMQFECLNKQQKIQKLRLMIEEYERKMFIVEDQYKDLLKTEKEANHHKLQILQNQLKCLESACRVQEMTRKELQNQNSSLRNQLKDKQGQILLIYQQINIIKSEIHSKDELKIKYAEINRQKGLAQIALNDINRKNQKLQEKQTLLKTEIKSLSVELNKVKVQYQSLQQSSTRKNKQIEELTAKVSEMQGTSQNSKFLKTFEWEIKYIQESQKDWREVVKEKNQKILELTEQLEKLKHDFGREQLKYIKNANKLQENISKLNLQLAELQAKLKTGPADVNLKIFHSIQEKSVMANSSFRGSQNMNNHLSNMETESRVQSLEADLRKQIQIRDLKIKKYEDYIDGYANNAISRNTHFYEDQIENLEKDVVKKEQIIQSLNELIYEKDKETNILKDKSGIFKFAEFQMAQGKQSLEKQLQIRRKHILRLNGQLIQAQKVIQYYRDNNKKIFETAESITMAIYKIKQKEGFQDLKSIITKVALINGIVSQNELISGGRSLNIISPEKEYKQLAQFSEQPEVQNKQTDRYSSSLLEQLHKTNFDKKQFHLKQPTFEQTRQDEYQDSTNNRNIQKIIFFKIENVLEEKIENLNYRSTSLHKEPSMQKKSGLNEAQEENNIGLPQFYDNQQQKDKMSALLLSRQQKVQFLQSRLVEAHHLEEQLKHQINQLIKQNKHLEEQLLFKLSQMPLNTEEESPSTTPLNKNAAYQKSQLAAVDDKVVVQRQNKTLKQVLAQNQQLTQQLNSTKKEILELQKQLQEVEHKRQSYIRMQQEAEPSMDQLIHLSPEKNKDAKIVQLKLHRKVFELQQNRSFLKNELNQNQDLRELVTALSAELQRRACSLKEIEPSQLRPLLEQLKAVEYRIQKGNQALQTFLVKQQELAQEDSQVMMSNTTRLDLLSIQGMSIKQSSRAAVAEFQNNHLIKPLTSSQKKDAEAIARLVKGIPSIEGHQIKDLGKHDSFLLKEIPISSSKQILDHQPEQRRKYQSQGQHLNINLIKWHGQNQQLELQLAQYHRIQHQLKNALQESQSQNRRLREEYQLVEKKLKAILKEPQTVNKQNQQKIENLLLKKKQELITYCTRLEQSQIQVKRLTEAYEQLNAKCINLETSLGQAKKTLFLSNDRKRSDEGQHNYSKKRRDYGVGSQNIQRLSKLRNDSQIVSQGKAIEGKRQISQPCEGQKSNNKCISCEEIYEREEKVNAFDSLSEKANQIELAVSSQNQKQGDDRNLVLKPNKDMPIEQVLQLFNNELSDFKNKYSQKCVECTQYLKFITENLHIKREYKTKTETLIKQKAKQGINQAQQAGRLLVLQTENSQLKAQLKQVMEDYRHRIEVINSLKTNLSFLNQSILSSQEQTQKIRKQSEKYQAKIKVKDQQLKQKQGQFAQLQNSYKSILQFYAGECQKSKRQLQQQRTHNTQQKVELQQQIHKLKTSFNRLNLDYQNLIRQTQTLQTQKHISNVLSSHLNHLQSPTQIEQRLLAWQEQRNMLQKQIDCKDREIIQLSEAKDRAADALEKEQLSHQQEVEHLQREQQRRKAENTRRIVELQGMVADLTIATQQLATSHKKQSTQRMKADQISPQQPSRGQGRQHLTGKESQLQLLEKEVTEHKGAKTKLENKETFQGTLSPKSRKTGAINVLQKYKIAISAINNPKGALSPRNKVTERKIGTVRSAQHK